MFQNPLDYIEQLVSVTHVTASLASFLSAQISVSGGRALTRPLTAQSMPFRAPLSWLQLCLTSGLQQTWQEPPLFFSYPLILHDNNPCAKQAIRASLSRNKIQLLHVPGRIKSQQQLAPSFQPEILTQIKQTVHLRAVEHNREALARAQVTKAPPCSKVNKAKLWHITLRQDKTSKQCNPLFLQNM